MDAELPGAVPDAKARPAAAANSSSTAAALPLSPGRAAHIYTDPATTFAATIARLERKLEELTYELDLSHQEADAYAFQAKCAQEQVRAYYLLADPQPFGISAMEEGHLTGA